MAERPGLGATDLAPILGVSPFGSALSVYCRVLDIGEKPEQNDAMKWGLRLEEAIAKAYLDADECGEVRRFNFNMINPCPKGPDEPMRHRPSDLLPELKEPISILIGTPDRILASGPTDEPKDWVRVLQLKTAHYRSARYWGPSGTDEVPEYYVPQVTWEMMLTGLPVCDVAALLGGSDYREYRIPFDPELGGMMLEAAKKFWADHIVPRIPPLEVGSADGQALARVFPRHKDEDLTTSTPEIDNLAVNLKVIREILTEGEEDRDEIENKLKAIIGDHAGIKGEWGHVSWKARKDSDVLDAKGLAEDLAMTANGRAFLLKHTHKRAGSRVFLCSFAGDE